MGEASVSAYQQARRIGHLEDRFRLPLTTAIRADVTTGPPDATLDELVWEHMLRTRHTTVCVVDGARYVGIVGVEDLGGVERDRWPAVTVGTVAHDDAPRAHPAWISGHQAAGILGAGVPGSLVGDRVRRPRGVSRAAHCRACDVAS